MKCIWKSIGEKKTKESFMPPIKEHRQSSDMPQLARLRKQIGELEKMLVPKKSSSEKKFM